MQRRIILLVVAALLGAGTDGAFAEAKAHSTSTSRQFIVYGADVRFVSLRPGQMGQGAQLAITGWLVDGKYWGRPVDLAFGKDGALYISDDLGGAVYRVTFDR